MIPIMNKKAIIFVVICTIFTSIGQIFYKLASTNFSSPLAILTNYWLYLGIFFYLIGAILLILALKYGKLSSVYPFIALSFVWVFLLSIILFKETISIIKVSGTLSIILGVIFIGKSK